MSEIILTEYQRANLSLWSRSQMVEFLRSEGLRGPRRKLRQASTDWLMQACIEEGALQCSECLQETTKENPILDNGRCEECEVKAQETEHDEVLCDCPCHDSN